MIEIIKCDIFKSNADVICHQVNTFGIMGAGIAAQIKKLYPEVYEVYKEKCLDYQKHGLNPIGNVLFCNTKYFYPLIANFFSQDDMTTNYNAMKNCLKIVHAYCKINKQTVAIPYGIGCGIARGDWDTVYGIIDEIFGKDDVKCLICQLEQ